MRSESGFTLVEVLVTAFIFVVLVTVILVAFSAGGLNWRIDMAQLDIFQPLRQSMDGMVREIRQAAGGTVTISGDNSQIDFTLSGFSVAYYLSAGNLIRECPPGTTKVLAQDVASLNFTQDDAVIRITAQGVKTVSGKDITLTLTEKARMRNDS